MSLDLENLGSAGADPFAPLADQGKSSNTSGAQSVYIHIRKQQRNGRKSLTTVQGLHAELDIKKICKALKKDFSCNGTVIEHEELGEVIQLQGDQRHNVARFLEAQGIAQRDHIKVHGA